MIIVELPIVYAKNFSEIEKAKESGIELEVDPVINMTTFIIPDNCLVRLNESSNENRTTVYFDDDAYEIDANYETVLEILKREIKK